MHIILLTHQRELLKKSGTGKLVSSVLKDTCEIITWKRKEPSNILTEKTSPENTVLVYPGESGNECFDITPIENFIIIDGTWQESNKIFNRSPYLKQFRQFTFPQNLKSSYSLRRNQKNYGLCTIESVIEIYRLKKLIPEADELEKIFINFQKQY